MSSTKKDFDMQLLKYLFTETDIEHKKSTSEIVQYFFKEYMKDINPKKVSASFDKLSDFGWPVAKIKKGSENLFYFQSPNTLISSERDIVIALITGAIFLSETETKKLINKIQKMSNKKNPCNRIMGLDNFSHKNPGSMSLINLESIYKAKNDKRSIKFEYMVLTPFDYNEHKNAAPYTVYPRDLYYDINENKIYLFAYDFNDKIHKTFRLDRIRNIEHIDVHEVLKPFNLKDYRSKLFNMNQGDECELKIYANTTDFQSLHEEIKKYLSIRSAKNIGKNEYIYTVRTSVNNFLFSWLSKFADCIAVISPNDIREKYKEYLYKSAENNDKVFQNLKDRSIVD